MWSLANSFTFNEQTVRYDQRGDGPPVVVVHGTPWSSYNWRHVITALSARYTVYYFDLLGYGESEKRAGQDVSLAVQNQLLAALLTHWQLDNPIVIAHDFGGTTALRAHLLNHCNYAKLVLCNPVALAPWGSPFFAHVQAHEAAFAGVPDYIHEAIVERYIAGAMHNAMPADVTAQILKPWLGPVGKAAFYRQIAQADQAYTDEIEPLYPTLRCPTLVVWGENDTWIPVAQGEKLAAHIPGSQFIRIQNASHLVQEDQPQQLIAHIQRFLAA